MNTRGGHSRPLCHARPRKSPPIESCMRRSGEDVTARSPRSTILRSNRRRAGRSILPSSVTLTHYHMGSCSSMKARRSSRPLWTSVRWAAAEQNPRLRAPVADHSAPASRCAGSASRTCEWEPRDAPRAGSEGLRCRHSSECAPCARSRSRWGQGTTGARCRPVTPAPEAHLLQRALLGHPPAGGAPPRRRRGRGDGPAVRPAVAAHRSGARRLTPAGEALRVDVRLRPPCRPGADQSERARADAGGPGRAPVLPGPMRRWPHGFSAGGALACGLSAILHGHGGPLSAGGVRGSVCALHGSPQA